MLGVHPVRLFMGAVVLTGLLMLVGGAHMAVSGGRTIWYVLGSGGGVMTTTMSSFGDGMQDAQAENDKQAKERAKTQAQARKP
jgi:Trk-type K+ transport system membrane component